MSKESSNTTPLFQSCSAVLPSLALLLPSLAGVAQGDPIYELDFEADEYSIATGAVGEVTIVFREITSAAETGKLAVGGLDGLALTGFMLDFATTVPSAQAGAEYLGVSIHPDFDSAGTLINEQDVDSGILIADLAVSDALFDAGTGAETSFFIDNQGRRVYQLELLTITFRNDNPLGASTLLTLQNSPTGQHGFRDRTAITPAFGSSSITTAVPEPHSLVLLLLAGIISVARGRVGRTT